MGLRKLITISVPPPLLKRAEQVAREETVRNPSCSVKRSASTSTPERSVRSPCGNGPPPS